MYQSAVRGGVFAALLAFFIMGFAPRACAQDTAPADTEPKAEPQSEKPADEKPASEEPAEQPAPAVARAEPEPAPSSALRTGLLWLRVTPPDASVYLDGRFLGSARELASLHGAIPVASGTHRVEALMPGYAGQSREITVEGKSPLDVQIDLERQ